MKQIIAMGGGGFSMEPENPLLDSYILRQSGKERPKVCFLGTASGDAEGYRERFYDFFNRMNCEPTHLSLIKRTVADLESFLLEQDIIYVGGGNTRNLLALWREWELDRILKQAWEQGILLAGISAGMICWFEQGVTDSIPGQLTGTACLGFLPGSGCPHYDGEADRRPSYHRMIASGEIGTGLAADDGVGLHFVGTKLHRVIASRPQAKAYRVELQGDEVVETELQSIYLRDSSFY